MFVATSSFFGEALLAYKLNLMAHSENGILGKFLNFLRWLCHVQENTGNNNKSKGFRKFLRKEFSYSCVFSPSLLHSRKKVASWVAWLSNNENGHGRINVAELTFSNFQLAFWTHYSSLYVTLTVIEIGGGNFPWKFMWKTTLFFIFNFTFFVGLYVRFVYILFAYRKENILAGLIQD